MIDWILAISFFLHLVATIVWLGGLALMTAVIWPETRNLLAKREQGGDLLALLERLRRRFTPLTNFSLVVLIATGLYQMTINPHYDGFLQFTNDWTRVILLKHIAVLGMMIIGVVMQWGVLPALERASLLRERGKNSPDFERLQARERQLSFVNLVFGLLVLLFTAMATAI